MRAILCFSARSDNVRCYYITRSGNTENTECHCEKKGKFRSRCTADTILLLGVGRGLWVAGGAALASLDVRSGTPGAAERQVLHEVNLLRALGWEEPLRGF